MDYNRSAIIVVGGQFGGEGKGNIVDSFAARSPRPLVIKTAGGANVSATVALAMGGWLPLQFYGAGVAAGAPTYLAKDTIIDPIVWHRERDRLKDLGVQPSPLFISKRARLALPIDVVIGQTVEIIRGKARRHGSTGHGIFETIKRCDDSRYDTRVTMITHVDRLREKAELIDKQYLVKRFQDHGIESLPDEARAALPAVNMMESYYHSCRMLAKEATLVEDGVLDGFDTLIFQGNQGLMLDRKFGLHWHPFLTPHKCGSRRAFEMAHATNVDRIEIIYALRPYFMRHGQGPLPNQAGDLSYPFGPEENSWQGAPRYAPLDIATQARFIRADIEDVEEASVTKGRPFTAHLAITHIDHVRREPFRWFNRDAPAAGEVEQFVDALMAQMPERIDRQRGYVGLGPHSDDVHEVLAQ